MQTAANRMPLLYKRVVLLTGERHREKTIKRTGNYTFATATNSIPLTLAEFPAAVRHYPIVFTTGESPSPWSACGRITTFLSRRMGRGGRAATFPPMYAATHSCSPRIATPTSSAYALTRSPSTTGRAGMSSYSAMRDHHPRSKQPLNFVVSTKRNGAKPRSLAKPSSPLGCLSRSKSRSVRTEPQNRLPGSKRLTRQSSQRLAMSSFWSGVGEAGLL